MLAKEISTLDVLSDGRTILGVGAGWSQAEFEGYGEWSAPKARVDKTLEGLELILKLWTSEGKVTHKGRYYTAKDAVLEPKPVQKPHPPLLFGGAGKRMLEMAGRYADICCIPPWQGLDSRIAKEVVMTSARKHSREDKLSFAQLSFGYEEGYNREKIVDKISKAKQEGCDYFIIGFREESYIDSMYDFAKNVAPSF
jgi:alkanesulfonate monooxygenase SsuD/methylene tetrahydromethanopterin reductase-like flavin-dependent oxidoreductase (luciferase family)